MTATDSVAIDVAVVGAGGCGLMAALVASHRGGRVLVLEKTGEPGGGTALSHRGLRAAGTRFQRAAGVDDSPEHYAAEILTRNRGRSDSELTLALTRVSARMIELLADLTDIDFHLDEFTFGQSVPRSHIWEDEQPITHYMYETLKNRSQVEFRFNTRVRSLLVEGDEVTGVETEDGAVRADSVILASGGFGANRDLLARFIPHAVDVAHPGHEANLGEGIEMAAALGAITEHMDSFQPYPAHVGPGKRGVPPGVITAGGIMVDPDGRRFTDESKYPGGLAGAILDLPGGQAYEIFDQAIFDKHRNREGERSIVDMQRTGDLRFGEDAASLAAALGIDASGLQQTLDDYARAAGGSDGFGRPVETPLRAPFYGIPVRVALYHTQGGVKVDHRARVLRADGTAIPHLYAGGGVAVGISGDDMDGYFPGNGLLASLGLGFIAAESAVGGGD